MSSPFVIVTVAVIVVLPLPTAVILPFSSIVAASGLDELHSIVTVTSSALGLIVAIAFVVS